jgi:hypothetical protein
VDCSGPPETAKRLHDTSNRKVLSPRMNKLPKWAGTAVIVLAVIVVVNLVKPMLPPSIAKYL